MIAIIKTGGKQYLVSPGLKIKIEKLDKKVGEEVEFKDVLLVEKDGKVEIGKPFLKDRKVLGKVIEQKKDKKVIVFKYKRKTRYKVKKGHRQPYTKVEILKIE
mgnify:CR=1 FL=1